MSSGPKWTNNSYTITIAEPETPAEEPFDNSTDVKDGTYLPNDENVTVVNPKDRNGNDNFRIQQITVKNGKATATVYSVSDKMTHIYVGSNADISAAEEDLVGESGNLITNVYAITGQLVEIPVKLNGGSVSIKTRTTAMSSGPKWTNNSYTITIAEPEEEKDADYTRVNEAKTKVPEDLSTYTEESVTALQKALDAVVEGKKASEQETVDGWATAIENALEGLKQKEGTPVKFEDLTDGTYTAIVKCNSSMFPVGKTCTVTKKGDVFDVVIKMKSASNVAQNTVYRGKKEDAPNHPEGWIRNGTDANGIYTFELKNVPIGEEFDLAAYSVNTKTWYDRRLIIDKDSFVVGEGQKPVDNNSSNDEEQSQSTEVLAGGTATIDNSTILPDGVYSPDSFSFSGGSGRATISCRSVTVVNGQAYATIVFSSNKYGYVKAAGGVYYPSIEGNTSVFTIPIQLNQNNTIIGMTTAMSQAHEITYSIYVYIAAAETGEGGAVEYLTGGEEIKLEKAELLKLFRFENGIVRVEIDRTKGTVLDPEKLAKETEETKKDEAVQPEAAIEDEEGTQSDVKTDADYLIELYQADVVKYLVIPENIELPAGLEKKAIIIRLPKKSLYVSSEDGVAEMESLGLLDLVKAVGIKEEDCKNEALKKLLEDNKVVSTGAMTDLNYTELVKAEADLVIGAGAEILPKEAEKDKTSKDYKEQYTKISERMALLDIPMLIDRSADEKDPKGQQEWLKLYGILFGKEDEADALIAKGIQ